MVTVDFSYLLGGQIRGYVREVAASNVISSLEDVLKYILHVAVESGWNTFAAHFVESLTASRDIFLNSGIALFGKHTGDIAGIGDSETICQWIFTHNPRIIGLPITYRATHHVTIFSDDFKHRGFAGADVAPKP